MTEKIYMADGSVGYNQGGRIYSEQDYLMLNNGGEGDSVSNVSGMSLKNPWGPGYVSLTGKDPGMGSQAAPQAAPQPVAQPSMPAEFTNTSFMEGIPGEQNPRMPSAAAEPVVPQEVVSPSSVDHQYNKKSWKGEDKPIIDAASFGEAFDKAKNELGVDVFWYNNKPYTTQLASTSKAAKAPEAKAPEAEAKETGTKKAPSAPSPIPGEASASAMKDIFRSPKGRGGYEYDDKTGMYRAVPGMSAISGMSKTMEKKGSPKKQKEQAPKGEGTPAWKTKGYWDKTLAGKAAPSFLGGFDQFLKWYDQQLKTAGYRSRY